MFFCVERVIIGATSMGHEEHMLHLVVDEETILHVES